MLTFKNAKKSFFIIEKIPKVPSSELLKRDRERERKKEKDRYKERERERRPAERQSLE